MSVSPSPTQDQHGKAPPTLTGIGVLTRLAAIGVVLLGVVAGFAYAGGWLSPDRLTPGRFVDRFEEVNGLFPGFRRNHAKGLCFTGSFDSNGQGAHCRNPLSSILAACRSSAASRSRAASPLSPTRLRRRAAWRSALRCPMARN